MGLVCTKGPCMYPHMLSMPMGTCTRDSCNAFTRQPRLSLTLEVMRTLETKD